MGAQDKRLVYTGGYTIPTLMGSGETVPPACPGIICFEWDAQHGTLQQKNIFREAVNPSWVEADPEGKYLYSVSELKDFAWENPNSKEAPSGMAGGSFVSAWRIGPEGDLTYLGSQATGGSDACHLLVSPNGKYLVCSNFSGGSVSLFPIREDHSLAPMSFLIRHTGHGTDPARQRSAHAHQAILAPDGKHLYISDLGLDRLVCYEADWENGILKKPETGDSSWQDIACLPGQGGRHAVFDSRGAYLYQMAEITCEVNVYRYDKENGCAERIQTLPALKEGTSPEGTLGAAIHIHDNGKWLYVSVRGTNSEHDLLVFFSIEADGRLVKRQTVWAGGKIPRDFSISPDGKYLLCGTADSSRITVFAIDAQEGTLSEHWKTDEAGGVTRIAFLG